MEAISRTLGGNIAALRKARGMTQEQLAARVGVSAPAVSKWETGSSCPDIALLCPLARALDTNVDTLLQFEQTLSDEEVTARMNALLGQALHGGPDTLAAVQQQLTELLHRYPNCTCLQYNAATAYDSFRLFFPTAEPSLQQEWKDRKRTLLRQVRDTGNAAYWQGATISLAAMEMADGDPEQGVALLKELPERTGGPIRSVGPVLHKNRPAGESPGTDPTAAVPGGVPGYLRPGDHDQSQTAARNSQTPQGVRRLPCVGPGLRPGGYERRAAAGTVSGTG